LLTIGAVADVHSPKYLKLFREAMDTLDVSAIDLMFLAGDMIYKGRVEEMNNIIDILERKGVNCPIIAVFGNEEFEDRHEKIRRLCEGKIIFLDDESVVLNLKGLKVGIVGTKGSLDKPTTWQARNIPNIQQIYSERIKKVDNLLANLNSDVKILLMHYAPTYKTLKGEKTSIYPLLGSKKFEEVILRRRPDLVIHAHAHNGSEFASLNGIPVYNVSLPLTRKICIIKLKGARGLDAFISRG